MNRLNTKKDQEKMEKEKGQLVKARHNRKICLDCNTCFSVINGNAICNDLAITLCPWCRKDSKPWTKGRGI